MPIVLSYNDINLLGQLAYQTGTLQGKAQAAQQRAANSARITAAVLNADAQRDAAAADMIASQTRADIARQQSIDQTNALQAQLGFRTDQANAAASQRAGLQQQDFEQDSARQQQQFDLNAQRDERRHQQDLDEIEARRQAGQWERPASSRQARTPAQRAGDEVEQFGDLIPKPAAGVSIEQTLQLTEKQAATAKQFSTMSTSQLKALRDAHPQDQWAGYLDAVIQSRQNVAGGGVAGQPADQASGSSGSLTQGKALSVGRPTIYFQESNNDVFTRLKTSVQPSLGYTLKNRKTGETVGPVPGDVMSRLVDMPDSQWEIQVTHTDQGQQ